jgi:periplasmic protein CpxP/Spy
MPYPYRVGNAQILKESAMKSNQGSYVKRALMVGLLAGSGVLAMTSFAMSGAGPAGACEGKPVAKMGAGMHARSAANRDERRDAYLAALKQKLDLQPAQEAAWNQFVDAAKALGGNRPERQVLRQEMQQLKTPERLDRMQAMAQQRQAKMQARGEAIKTFYAQLTTEQQSVFDASRPSKGRDGHGHRHGPRQS